MKKNENDQNAKAKEKNNGLTELVFILDKSGSMSGLEGDTIGGFNSMLKKQREKGEGEVLVTTVLFSSRSEMIHDRRPIAGVPELTDREYAVGGCTALLDAIGETINYIENAHKKSSADIPGNVLFVITTDGLENASSEYSSSAVKKMITAKQKKGWEFLFMAANIDAVETAARYGIREEHAVNYRADAAGTANNFVALEEAVTCMRQKGKVGKKWKKIVDDDFNGRKD